MKHIKSFELFETIRKQDDSKEDYDQIINWKGPINTTYCAVMDRLLLFFEKLPEDKRINIKDLLNKMDDSHQVRVWRHLIINK